jgi:tetratricopeptide (TPR) repeat protein
VHNYIGLIHWNQGKDELAMSEFEASIKIAETFDFQRHLHTALHNLGNVYARRGELHSNPDDLQKALCFFEKSLNIEETLKDDNAIALSHNNIGNVHRLLGSRQKALEHYHTALALSEKIGAKYTRIDVLINLGLFYIEEKNFTTAHLHLNEALALSESVQSNSQIVDILDALTQVSGWS